MNNTNDIKPHLPNSEKMSELFAVCMSSAALLDAIVRLPEYKPYALAEIDRTFAEINQINIKIAALKAQIAELSTSKTVLDASQWSWCISVSA